MIVEKIVIVGLGYVGLPLAVHLSKHFEVVGFDLDVEKVKKLSKGSFDPDVFDGAAVEETINIAFTSDIRDAAAGTVFIICVPTPVCEEMKPDLTLIKNAASSVGSVLKPGDLVVNESTVYPGVTGGILSEILERYSGLSRSMGDLLREGKSFHLGYSPERVNPGDPNHDIANVTKVISGDDSETIARMKSIYGLICPSLAECSSIKTAELSKLLENTQRDVNIALVNEVAEISKALSIDFNDVLRVANTKWNFLEFTPGLVGGHCIAVDPYYLTYVGNLNGVYAELVDTARRVNERVVERIFCLVRETFPVLDNLQVLVVGCTFKENCSDTRNSKALDLCEKLYSEGAEITIFDPLVEPSRLMYSCVNQLKRNDHNRYDLILILVAHNQVKEISQEMMENLLHERGKIYDFKDLFPALDASKKLG